MTLILLVKVRWVELGGTDSLFHILRLADWFRQKTQRLRPDFQMCIIQILLTLAVSNYTGFVSAGGLAF